MIRFNQEQGNRRARYLFWAQLKSRKGSFLPLAPRNWSRNDILSGKTAHLLWSRVLCVATFSTEWNNIEVLLLCFHTTCYVRRTLWRVLNQMSLTEGFYTFVRVVIHRKNFQKNTFHHWNSCKIYQELLGAQTMFGPAIALCAYLKDVYFSFDKQSVVWRKIAVFLCWCGEAFLVCFFSSMIHLDKQILSHPPSQ